MSTSHRTSWISGLMARARRNVIERLHDDERGVAAVEFAMIVPIMFFLFVGSVEFSQALTVDRRITQSASSVADLVARVQTTDTASVEGMMKVVELLMTPYDVSPMNMTIVAVRAFGPKAEDIKIYYSRNNKSATPYTVCSQYKNLPAGLLSTGESVIVGEVKYNYSPLIFKWFIQAAFDMEERFYLKPRQSQCVTFDSDNCVTKTCP